jgi:hypothetical protein
MPSCRYSRVESPRTAKGSTRIRSSDPERDAAARRVAQMAPAAPAARATSSSSASSGPRAAAGRTGTATVAAGMARPAPPRAGDAVVATSGASRMASRSRVVSADGSSSRSRARRAANSS